MFNEAELMVLRRAYARQVAFLGDVHNAALERAYTEVPREAYLGPGPWPIFRWTGYTPTPDADPAWLYSDILIGLVPERGLNNGQPSAHAGWIAAAAPAPGEHVVHIGAGAGYYSAIMAHMVGSTGALTAIEYDQALAARAAANLAHLPNVQALHGDGSMVPFAPADVIYVNAGASRPADAYASGERFRRRVCRTPQRAPAPKLRPDKGGYHEVTRLRRTDDVSEEECWVRAPGWSLTYS